MQLQLIGLRKCYGFYQEEGKKASGKKQPLEMFYKKGFFKTLAKSTGKHFCWYLFFNNIAYQITSSCHPKRLFFLNMCIHKKDQITNFGSSGIFVCLCSYEYIFLVFYQFFFKFLQPGQIQDKVFKSGLSKFCGRQPSKNLNGYGLLQPLSNFKFLKGCLPEKKFSLLLNTLSQLFNWLVGAILKPKKIWSH